MARGKLLNATLNDGTYNIDELDYRNQLLNARIDAVQNLGHFVGTFPTKAALPLLITDPAFAQVQPMTANDYAYVTADETQGGGLTLYKISAVVSSSITWTYCFSVNATDVTGKMDKVPGATSGNIATFGAGGQVVDSTTSLTSINTALSGKIGECPNDGKAYSRRKNGAAAGEWVADWSFVAI